MIRPCGRRDFTAPPILVDRGQLETVLVNLATNAPPAAAPTMRVQQANNLPQAMPAAPPAPQ